jgi:hypothetical protein
MGLVTKGFGLKENKDTGFTVKGLRFRMSDIAFGVQKRFRIEGSEFRV